MGIETIRSKLNATVSQKGFDAHRIQRGPGHPSDKHEHASVCRDGLGLKNTVLN